MILEEVLKKWESAEAIKQLSEVQRAAVWMRCVEGYKRKEVSQILGVSERSITTWMKKVKKNLA